MEFKPSKLSDLHEKSGKLSSFEKAIKSYLIVKILAKFTEDIDPIGPALDTFKLSMACKRSMMTIFSLY